MFYVHKGIEKRFERLPVNRAVCLAESISGDSSFSHGVAFCQAIEQAAGMEIPERAKRMRTILLELERIYNHVGDIGAIAADVGFVIANAHASRLREMILCLNEELTGSRLLRGMVCPGGVRWNWKPDQIDECVDVLSVFEPEFADLMLLIETSDSTRDRLERCKIKDPSLNNWPALVEAVQGNIVPDFPVINKSFNLSYSGTDR
jgi:Ni,Fe-hydrogenase III large subunit